MRPILCTIVVAAICSSLSAADPLASARQRWLRGNIAEAREQYEKLAKDPKRAAAAAIGMSRTWEAEGEYQKALDAIPADATDPALLARRAELMYTIGRLDEALKSADAAIAKQTDQFLAHWVRANIKLDRGDLPNADAEFRWFVRGYTAREQARQPIKDADTLFLVAQAGAINARWHNLNDQFRFILNEVLGDALKADADFWPAESLAGELLLEKYNRPEALVAFDKALAINPRAVPAIVGKGRLALQQFELKDAEQFARQALEINPRNVEALHLIADMHFVSGEITEAVAKLHEAKTVNPVSEATLAREAVCFYVAKRQAEFDALCKEVESRDPKPGRFYSEIAERLDDRRLFDDAQRYYRKALEHWPHSGEAKTGLGMLAMRLGQEDEARKVLTEAFKADRFNVMIANSLKVLRHLNDYETITTPHFAVRFDPKNDATLGRFMADALEQEYERLAAQFQYRPKGPILIEVFNRHDMFSGRTTGLPDLHTIGACTGRIVAMVSPKGQGIKKPFNWGRVIRHELVHIFNLEQTNFQVPHWLTEGLAVRNERIARPTDWLQLLAERAGSDRLLDLNTINLGFMRPRSPAEWTLAYCQAQLYVDHLTKSHGEEAIAKLLDAYREGLDTPAALRRASGIDVGELEKAYKQYVRDVVAQARGKPPEKPLTLVQLEEAVMKSPNDLDLAARLAEQYWKRRRTADARRIVDRVLQQQAKHGLALFVKAQLLFGAGEDEHAQQLLELAAAIDPPEPKVLRALGKQHFDAGQMDRAEAMYRRGREAEPNDPSWLEELARVYKQTDNSAQRIAVLAELAPLNADDLEIRRELAERLGEAKRWPEAERWARETLDIDVEDPKARQVLFDALAALGKNDEAARLRKLFDGP